MTTLRTGLRIASSSARTVRPVIPHSTRGPITCRAPATPFARALSTVPPTVDPDVPPKPNTAGQLKTQTDAKYKPMYIFGALTSIGLLITIYSLVEYYFALPKWPETVRTPLRRALRAKSLGDLERSEGFFKEALTAALALPPSEFAPDPLLKLSGLYITYAVLLEEMKKRSEAYVLLRDGLDHFGPQALSPDASARRSGAWAGEVPLSQEDHVRAIGLAQKLGHLSLQLATASRVQIYPSKEDGPKTWLDASEKHLSDALTAMLKLGLTTPTAENGKTPRVIAGRDVNLPDARAPEDEQEVQLQGGSVDKKGLGVTMEALAEIYARKGEYSIAGNLLIQAISMLLPPKTSEPPPIPDQCQAAMLMTTISSHALQPNTTKAIKASRSWSLRALQISDQAIQANQGGNADTLICSKALAVGSYNLGMLAEMEGDLKEALVQFDRSLKTSRTISFTEGSRLAVESIQRVRALTNTSK